LDPRSLIGTTFAGNYEILAIAGSGGMGTVLKARQSGLDRMVAIKLLGSTFLDDVDEQKRFEREARALSQLLHAHIARFYLYGADAGGQLFTVMEWLEGNSLSSLIHRLEKLAPERAVKIALQIADAAGYAHKAGIIHRDLKPANVMLLQDPEKDFVKVVDFGLARLLAIPDSQSQRLTATGALFGTPFYMSPEQCTFQKADGRSDIYALGCILYEMLCGSPPFVSTDPLVVMKRHQMEEPVLPFGKSVQHLPAGLETIILKCLAKDPQNRYQSMDELVSDLQLVEQNSGQSIKWISPGQRKQCSDGQRRAVALAGAGLLAAVTSLCLFFSDLFVVERAGLSLKLDASEQNCLYWQHTSEQLSRQNEPDKALRVAIAVSHSLNLKSMEPVPAIKVSLGFADKLLKFNDNRSASEYALSALTMIAASLAKDEKSAPALVLDAEEAAGILLQTKVALNKDRIQMLTHIARISIDELEKRQANCLLSLIYENSFARQGRLYKVILGNSLPEDLRRCLEDHDKMLVVRGEISSYRESIERTKILLRQYEKQPKSMIAVHVSKLAIYLSLRFPDDARKAVDEVTLLIRNPDNIEDPAKLPTIYSHLASANVGLHDPVLALHWARKNAAVRPLVDLSAAGAQQQLIDALIVSGRTGEAKPLCRKLYKFLKSQPSTPKGMVLLQYCQTQLRGILN
jgi:serine/threonine protein kinase